MTSLMAEPTPSTPTALRLRQTKGPLDADENKLAAARWISQAFTPRYAHAAWALRAQF